MLTYLYQSNLDNIIHQRRLALNEEIRDAAGNRQAYSEFEYDNYNPDTNRAAVTVNPGMLKYDGARFTPFLLAWQPRGNVTKAARLLSGSTYTTGYSQYDNAGHPVLSKDPKGNLTTLSYTDNFGDGTNPESGSGGTNGATFALLTQR